jgi:hypothetical protein
MDFHTLEGLTLSEITGCHKGSGEILFTTTDGRCFRMFHWQDCCESVDVEDVVGDVVDLIGHPILRAEERSNGVQDVENGHGDVEQWTFYTIATIRGTVDLRWYGISNGYYSTGVSFEEVTRDQERNH